MLSGIDNVPFGARLVSLMRAAVFFTDLQIVDPPESDDMDDIADAFLFRVISGAIDRDSSACSF